MMTSNRKPKVWASFDPPESVIDYLSENLDLSYNATGELATHEMIHAKLGDAEGLFVTLRDMVDEDLLNEAPNLKVVSNLAVGYDNVDVKAASKKGIWVTNTPGVLTEATADLAWALLFAVARRIPEGDRMVRDGSYTGWRHNLLLGTELSGKTLGIWGGGRIGQAIGRRGLGFNMRIIYNNRSRKEEFERENNAQFVEFDELLQRSDFLVLAMPLNSDTANQIGRAEFEQMKRSAFLINIARGGLIREDEMIAVLKEQRIAGAGLDVYVDTTGIGAKLGDLDHVVLTPHIGSATHETRRQMALMASRNLVDALHGREPENAVNRKAIYESNIPRNGVRNLISV
ncbi:D-glycerate dehydrogenase [bacterium]|nr:D-glycerate dehydrogenase [bacterium]